jgi:hypothetical protein
MKPTIATRRARIARVNAKRPDPIAVRIEYAEVSDPEAETAIDRWLLSMLDKHAAPGQR